jgi:MFS family permease
LVCAYCKVLALGGEYGGAATYVAEHAPASKRGAYTAWIQTTATAGLFLSLMVILITREVTGPNFEVWGWRVPFIISVLLLLVSLYIRLQMAESPAFQKMKSEGKLSKSPIGESFRYSGKILKIVILALFGLVAGQAVVWYTGQFYALFFLTQVLKVDADTANIFNCDCSCDWYPILYRIRYFV